MGFSYTLLNLHCIIYKQSSGTLIEAFCYKWQRVFEILIYVSKNWKNSSQQRKQIALQQMTGAWWKKSLSHWPPPLQHLSIITTDLMILRAFSNLNDSMILSHVRAHTCKRLALIYLCPGYLITDEHNFKILLFIYLRIFRFQLKHFHKLRNFEKSCLRCQLQFFTLLSHHMGFKLNSSSHLPGGERDKSLLLPELCPTSFSIIFGDSLPPEMDSNQENAE